MRKYYYKCVSCKKIFDKPFNRCPYCNSLVITEYSEPRFKIDKDRRGIWRYSTLLPDFNVQISKGEGLTPLINIDRENNVYIKNERHNPTGSYVDRSSAVITSYVSENNISKIGILYSEDFTTSLLYYLNDRSVEIFVEDILNTDLRDLMRFLDSKTIIKTFSRKDDETMIFEYVNPLTIEGLKTILFEIYEKNIDIENIVVPTERGVLAYSLYKGLRELRDAGLDVSYNIIAVISRQNEEPEILRGLKDVKIMKVSDEEIIESFMRLFRRGVETKPLSAMSYIVAENLRNSVAVITMGFKTYSTSHIRSRTLRQHIINLLREKGPMTAYQIWREIPSYSLRGVYKTLKNMELRGEVDVIIEDKGFRKIKYYTLRNVKTYSLDNNLSE